MSPQRNDIQIRVSRYLLAMPLKRIITMLDSKSHCQLSQETGHSDKRINHTFKNTVFYLSSVKIVLLLLL